VDQKSQQIICTSFCNGKKHDFKLFKESRLQISAQIQTLVDSGYAGITKIHPNSELPIKRRKNKTLSKKNKKFNRELSSKRVLVENVIARLKKYKILSDRYRNRRKRFGLRFNLICGITNFERSLGAL